MFDPSAVLVISNGNNPAVFGMVTEVMKFSPDVISCDDGKISERLAAGNIACIICFAGVHRQYAAAHLPVCLR